MARRLSRERRGAGLLAAGSGKKNEARNVLCARTRVLPCGFCFTPSLLTAGAAMPSFSLTPRRRRMEYPELKRAVREQAVRFKARTVLIEDKSSGTALIQELTREGLHAVTRYEPKLEKIMRLNSVTSTIERGFVYLTEKATWLADYLHELTTFPNGKFDDQCDSTSQALDWVKTGSGPDQYVRLMKHLADRADSDTSSEQIEPRVTRADMLNGRWPF